MAMTLKQLTKSLKTNEYTPRTDAQLRTEAENRFASTFNQQKLAAQQSYEASDQAYQQQLQTLADDLALGQQQITKETASSAASADRYSLTRGMGRASYTVANKARIQNQGINNLANLMKQYSSNVSGVQASRTQLAQKLADTLAQYEIDHQNDINNYIDEQKQLDYDRKVAADAAFNQVQMALYGYGKK